MTNFDFLKSKRTFDSFADAAIAAERIFSIDPSACVLNCRRAMEFAVKWMYSVDKALVMPYQDTLVSLMSRYALNDHLSVSAHVDNLFDKRYYEQIGFYSQGWYGEPRNLRLSVRATF